MDIAQDINTDLSVQFFREGILANLPLPEKKRNGWPWTKETRPCASATRIPWPRITVVTPSYNQGEFLEETIRSVLLQNYPNLEYLVIDGGSSDNSVEIIRKYEPWLTCWVSEKDDGQTDAILKGFAKASGAISGWINSDDYYLPGAFHAVARNFIDNPDIDLLIGGYEWVRENGRIVTKHYSYLQDFESLLCAGQRIGQMGCFWKRDAFYDTGGFDRGLKFCFDYDMFLRLAKARKPFVIDRVLAAYRVHAATKTAIIWENTGLREQALVQKRHGIDAIPTERRSQVVAETLQGLHRAYISGLVKDMFRDPAFFIKHLTCKIIR